MGCALSQDIAVEEEDHFQIERVDEAIEVWTEMMLADHQHQRNVSDHLCTLQGKFRDGTHELQRLLTNMHTTFHSPTEMNAAAQSKHDQV